jgi:hypothetical protein
VKNMPEMLKVIETYSCQLYIVGSKFGIQGHCRLKMLKQNKLLL